MNPATLFPIFITLTSQVSRAVQQFGSTPSFLQGTLVKSSAPVYLEPSPTLDLPGSPLQIQNFDHTDGHFDDLQKYPSSSAATGFRLSNERTIKHSDTGINSKIKFNKRKRRWSNFAAWGKRDSDTSIKNNGEGMLKRWGNSALWGKRNYDDVLKEMLSPYIDAEGNDFQIDPVVADKKWNQMAVWGKRTSNQHKNTNSKMDPILIDDFENSIKHTLLGDAALQIPYQSLSNVYGRPVQKDHDDMIAKTLKQFSSEERGAGVSPNKRWNQMSVWGKRYDGDINDVQLGKRWKEQSLWGKRNLIKQLDKRWRQMSLWGKREYVMNNYNQPGMLNKRWKNTALWGKRSDPILDKKWSDMSVWGKRSGDDTPETHDWLNSDGSANVDKRWKSSALWGKRDPENVDAFQTMDKKWVDRSDSDKITSRKIRNWRDIKLWGRKRPSWSRTGFTSWGKRSGHDGEGLIDQSMFETQATSIGDSGQRRSGDTDLE